MNEPKDKEFDVIVAKILLYISKEMSKATEFGKKEAKPFAWLYTFRGFKPYLKNYKKVNRHLKRKKEKAHILALREIATSIQFEKTEKDDRKLSNMLKRLS